MPDRNVYLEFSKGFFALGKAYALWAEDNGFETADTKKAAGKAAVANERIAATEIPVAVADEAVTDEAVTDEAVETEISFDTVRKKILGLAKKDRNAAVRLLKEYGVRKPSQLKPEQYEAVVANIDSVLSILE